MSLPADWERDGVTATLSLPRPEGACVSLSRPSPRRAGSPLEGDAAWTSPGPPAAVPSAGVRPERWACVDCRLGLLTSPAGLSGRGRG